jgi:hypothetical protein
MWFLLLVFVMFFAKANLVLLVVLVLEFALSDPLTLLKTSIVGCWNDQLVSAIGVENEIVVECRCRVYPLSQILVSYQTFSLTLSCQSQDYSNYHILSYSLTIRHYSDYFCHLKIAHSYSNGDTNSARTKPSTEAMSMSVRPHFHRHRPGWQTTLHVDDDDALCTTN